MANPPIPSKPAQPPPSQPSPNSLTQPPPKAKTSASGTLEEHPASVDFAGRYPYTNIGEPGENRDDDTPIEPPSTQPPDEHETVAEEQRRRSEFAAAHAAKAAKAVDRNTPPYANRPLPADPRGERINSPAREPVNSPVR